MADLWLPSFLWFIFLRDTFTCLSKRRQQILPRPTRKTVGRATVCWFQLPLYHCSKFTHLHQRHCDGVGFIKTFLRVTFQYEVCCRQYSTSSAVNSWKSARSGAEMEKPAMRKCERETGGGVGGRKWIWRSRYHERTHKCFLSNYKPYFTVSLLQAP